MHSTDLPVTDYWDPEWDVYDVPFSPADDGVDWDIWWAAYCHLWDLRWVMDGSAEYRPDFRGRELTTGCVCRDRPGWDPGRPGNPTCPVHGRCPEPSDPVAKHATPPCLCRYGLRPIEGIVGMFPLDPWAEYTRFKGVYAFRIHPRCPHHGDAAVTEAACWTVLDEQERGDH